MFRLLRFGALSLLAGALLLVASPASAQEPERRVTTIVDLDADDFRVVSMTNGAEPGSVNVVVQGPRIVQQGPVGRAVTQADLDGLEILYRENLEQAFIDLREDLIEFPDVTYDIDLEFQICADAGATRACSDNYTLDYDVVLRGNPADDVESQFESMDLLEDFEDYNAFYGVYPTDPPPSNPPSNPPGGGGTMPPHGNPGGCPDLWTDIP
jgi:hypothetical protein